ncbi:MAG: NUDIX domain-containing protein [Nanobdellota archaeon]
MDRPEVIVNSAVYNGDDILLIKRNKQPFKGKWALIGGKLETGESIPEAAVREVKEETGLDTEFIGIKGVYNEVADVEGERRGFLFILCEVRAENRRVTESREGSLSWFSVLPEDMVPQDRWRLSNNSEVDIPELRITQEKGSVRFKTE